MSDAPVFTRLIDNVERVLLGKAAKGDAAAFEDLYRRYAGPVGAFLYRMCWDRAVAEDCLQDVFLKLWRAAGDFKGESMVGTYIFKIAKNHWINVADKRSRREGKLAEAAAARRNDDQRSQEPLARVEKDEIVRLARAAVDRLDDPHRMVFVLAHYGGMKYRDIGGVLEIPVGTVKSRMAAAERRLREALAPMLDGE